MTDDRRPALDDPAMRPAPADRDGQPSGRGETVDPRPDARAEAIGRRLHERAETVRRRELATAVGRLEARGPATAAERDALDAMTERLVADLLAPARDGLHAAAAADDPATMEAIRRLFDE